MWCRRRWPREQQVDHAHTLPFQATSRRHRETHVRRAIPKRPCPSLRSMAFRMMRVHANAWICSMERSGVEAFAAASLGGESKVHDGRMQTHAPNTKPSMGRARCAHSERLVPTERAAAVGVHLPEHVLHVPELLGPGRLVRKRPRQAQLGRKGKGRGAKVLKCCITLASRATPDERNSAADAQYQSGWAPWSRQHGLQRPERTTRTTSAGIHNDSGQHRCGPRHRRLQVVQTLFGEAKRRLLKVMAHHKWPKPPDRPRQTSTLLLSPSESLHRTRCSSMGDEKRLPKHANHRSREETSNSRRYKRVAFRIKRNPRKARKTRRNEPERNEHNNGMIVCTMSCLHLFISSGRRVCRCLFPREERPGRHQDAD